jgi:hypothetical protein
MKAVAKSEPRLTNDPKPMDRATWQRMRVVVEHEACHRDWGCALYILHRTGKINNDQREAGDRYATLARDYKKMIAEPIMELEGFAAYGDQIGEAQTGRNNMVLNRGTGEVKSLPQAMSEIIAENKREPSEFEDRRERRLTRRYKEAGEVIGPIRRALEDMLLDEIWPVGERSHLAISHALTRLGVFFNTGTKRKR